MRTKQPGQKIKVLCKALGSQYSIKQIDFEYVICRDFDNGFRLVISDVDNSFEDYCVTIAVWNTTKDLMSDCFYNVYPASKIKTVVEQCVEKYSNLVQDINGNIVV